MPRPKSLQQQLVVFVLLPVALLLAAMGFLGFVYARNTLLSQWQEAAVLRLQRAAHQVDMRLARVKELIAFFSEASDGTQLTAVRSWALARLERLDVVDHVHLEAEENAPALRDHPHRRQEGRAMGRMDERGMQAMRRFHRARFREITPPRYDEATDHETVSLISDLNDADGRRVGRLEVVLDFDALIADVRQAGWWQSNQAFLVGADGRIFASTAVVRRRGSLAESPEPLERRVAEALQSRSSGTILGAGRPPRLVAGFHRLEQAPWSLVLIAPGEAILAPMLRFRNYYFGIVAGSVVLILVLIRAVAGRTVAAVKEISQAAERVAAGRFDEPLAVNTAGEIGELARSFNTMMAQLEERLRMKQALAVAQEVQQNLLPPGPPRLPGLDIAVCSLYCDETGGDFYDFLRLDRGDGARLGISVGDVSGHGIPAALLMATVKALVRSSLAAAPGPAEGIARANRLLVEDMRDTGRFVTLFYAEIAPAEGSLQWVRAGHEPALLYDPAAGRFRELHGRGVALGVDPAAGYDASRLPGLAVGQILILATDGLWEARGPGGEMFGRRRLREIVRRRADAGAQELVAAVTDALRDFRGQSRQEDDVTLLVVKFGG